MRRRRLAEAEVVHLHRQHVRQIVQAQPEHPQLGPAAPGAEQHNQVNEKQCHERPPADAMDHPAHVAPVVHHAERPTPGGIGKLVDKPGVGQEDEQHNHRRVLHPHPTREPQLALLCFRPAYVLAGLVEVVERVVRQHPANGGDDQEDVDPAHEIHQPRFPFRRAGRRMDAEELRTEPGADARVTLAAGLRQVLGVDGRQRVAGGQDVMHAVTGGATGSGQVATLQRQAMETLDVGAEDIWRQPVLRDNPLGGMTLAAGIRDVGGRHP